MQSLRNIQKTERFLARQDKTRIMHISGKTCICQSEKVVVLLNEKDKETRLLTTPGKIPTEWKRQKDMVTHYTG